MKKSLKIIISIIVFMIILLISKESNALSVSRSPHGDHWSGKSEFFVNGNTYCKEKGGTLRFTPPNLPESGEYNNGNVCGIEQIHGHSECPNYTGFVDRTDRYISAIKGEIESKMEGLLEGCSPLPLSGVWSDYWNNANYSAISAQAGTIVSQPYTVTASYGASGGGGGSNNADAYMMSAGSQYNPQTRFGLKKGNYMASISDIADSQLVQDAIWCSNINEGRRLSSPTAAMELVKEANDYNAIASQLVNYNPTIIENNAQVIAKRSNGTYVIGPYIAQYPTGNNSLKFSYIQDIYIASAGGQKIATPTVISTSKPYPKSGEPFFLEFSAAESGNPSSVCVKIEFGYLQNTQASYTVYTAPNTPIKQLVGWVDIKDISHTIPVEKDGYDEDGNPKIEIVDETCHAWEFCGKIRTVTIGYYRSQKLMDMNSSREWKQKALISNPINLRMELGGIVWVDNTGGKESVNDSKYGTDNDTPMSNVPVTLYTAGGSQVGSTTTGGDGKYKFTGLDAMQQYYVKFTYNSQYYEPVNYEGASSWAGSNWRVNSNGTDKVDERNNINARFASIGSTPSNYFGANGVNKTYTRTELKNSGAIDEFGNLSGGDSSQSQFVRDCQLESYTGNGTGGTDLYPVWDTFVIDKAQYSGAGSYLVPRVNVLYDTAYYINQGYKEKQVTDMALRKDVEKATLEINGKVHTYDYDTRKITDTQVTTNNGKDEANIDSTWDINVRLSDGYYNTKYSRELYKSDYAYKVSNYGTNYVDYGKDKSDELNVYVTYKITVRNQSMSIRTRIDEIVDYYDADYTYEPDRSYIEIKSGTNAGRYAADPQYYKNNTKLDVNQSKYGVGTQLNMTDYKNLYIRGMGQYAEKVDETGKVIGTVNDGIYLDAGQTAYVYVTFKVNKNAQDGEEWVILDETVDEAATAIGVGKENITEINGYSTIYGYNTTVPNVGDVTGRAAGLIDKDSNPGNLNPVDVPKDGNINYRNFEDDTDKAPDIRIILYKDDSENRTIAGTVWEDTRNETIGATTTGNGLNENETPVNGVTVQLVELLYVDIKDANGNVIGQEQREFIWRTFEEGSGTASITKPIINVNNLVKDYEIGETGTGKYAFKSFMPGNYVIRFIYGDTTRTVLTSDATTSVNSELGKTGLNAKSYNGQDYKSTTYQEGITQTDKTYTWRQPTTWLNGKATLGAEIKTIQTYKDKYNQNETNTYLYDITTSELFTNVSDAKDIESRREQVINYSNSGVINNIAETLASHEELPCDKTQLNQYIQDLMTNTNMTSETGLMNIELEYDRDGTGNNIVGNHTTYPIKTVDLGLEERPKAQLAINKEVTNVKVTLANGSVLFDAQGPATNVLWQDHKAYEVGYTGSTGLLDANKFGNIQNIRNKNAQKFGLIQLSMDEELMHGATIKISYNITVSNVGEADYNDNEFYYTGNIANANIKNSIVKTKADQVIDYVENNLQFYAADNNNWKVITQAELQNESDRSKDLVNHTLKDEIAKYNTIITTSSLSTELIPTIYKNKVDGSAIDNVSVPLVLTQLITSENDTDDLTYFNTVEIVKTSNTVGRRNNFSVVGNQNPKGIITEMDSDRAEEVKILPPFGDTSNYFTIGAIIAGCSLLMIGGIIFIKKKVLK